ncbi:hypothetical protein ACFSQ7_47575 [Paenibacillus rhizoplanae]
MSSNNEAKEAVPGAKNRYYGLYFILPWFAGFCFLFLTPLLSSLRFSLSNLQVNDEGFTLKIYRTRELPGGTVLP